MNFFILIPIYINPTIMYQDIGVLMICLFLNGG